MMFDYHIHPDYSIDAEPHSIDEYCREAVLLGIGEICFTPHLEVDPVRKHLDWFVRVNGSVRPMDDIKWIEYYFKEIEKARNKWSGTGLLIKAGLEVGYERGKDREIERIVLNYPFDFIIGSVHCLDHRAISSRSESRLFFPGKKARAVITEYYEIFEEAVTTGLFDCIGHVDLYRRYGGSYFSEDDMRECESISESLFKQAARRGIGVEVNTSSLRRGQKNFHPAFSLIKLALQSGVSIFTVGSDAHRLSELGRGVEGAVEMLAGLGIEPATYCLRRACVKIEKGGQTYCITIK